jgi:hypothetical protein
MWKGAFDGRKLHALFEKLPRHHELEGDELAGRHDVLRVSLEEQAQMDRDAQRRQHGGQDAEPSAEQLPAGSTELIFNVGA